MNILITVYYTNKKKQKILDYIFKVNFLKETTVSYQQAIKHFQSDLNVIEAEALALQIFGATDSHSLRVDKLAEAGTKALNSDVGLMIE